MTPKINAFLLRTLPGVRKAYVKTIEERNHYRAEHAHLENIQSSVLANASTWKREAHTTRETLDAIIAERDKAVADYYKLVAACDSIADELERLRIVNQAVEGYVELIELAHRTRAGSIEIQCDDDALRQVLKARINNLCNALNGFPLEDEPPLDVVTARSPSKLVH